MNNTAEYKAVIKKKESEVTKKLRTSYTLFTEDLGFGTSYSVEVKIAETGEISTVHDITRDPQKAELIFDMICDGTVTPCCLAEVTEDLIETLI